MTKPKVPATKITADVKALRSAVGWAASAIDTKPKQPLLSAAVLSMTSDGLLSVSGYNLEVSTAAVVEVEGTIEPTLVPGHLLRNMLDQLDGQVSIELAGTNLTLSAGRARYTMRTMPGEFYPSQPALPPVVGKIAAGDLREIVTRAGLATSRDSKEAILTGMRLRAADGRIQAVATDKYRLHRVEFPWAGDDFTAVVPARQLADAAKMMDGQVTVMLAEDAGIIGLTDGDHTATIRLMAAEYPAVDSLFNPGTDEPRLVVAREEIVQALKTVGVVATKNAVRMDVGATSATISAVGDDTGDSDVEVSADSDTEDKVLHLDAAFLIDGVSALTGTHVEMMLPKSGAGRMTMRGMAAADAEPNQAVTVLVMTVRKASE